MKTRKCAVCGKVKKIDKMGDGCRVPKTTCLACKAKIIDFTEKMTVLTIKRIIMGGHVNGA